MMSKLKIKRGNAANLPQLSVGEPAFTLDTKNLYIGGSSSNININTVHKNFLINSNFQVNLEGTDVGTFYIAAGAGRYIFGNYYLENLASAPTSLSYSKPSASNYSLLRLAAANGIAKTSLSYYEKLTPLNIAPLENSLVTLSFDTVATETIAFTCGVPGATVQSTIPTGSNRNAVTFTYTSTALTGTTLSINFILFQGSITQTLYIGNFKIEQGNYATPYSPNSINYDVAMLKQSYYIFRNVQRSAFLQAGTTNTFFDMRIALMNSNPKVTYKDAVTYGLGGPVALNPANITYGGEGMIRSSGSYPSNDLAAYTNSYVDNRPQR